MSAKAFLFRNVYLLTAKQTAIDTSNVLLLSTLENFREGTIFVREQEGLQFDIFRSYTSAKDTAGAIKALRKYGPEEPQLYPAALAYFTSDPKILEEAGDKFNAVLKKIDDDNLMAPLQVIQTLSTNSAASMGLVQKYLSETIEREQREIANVGCPDVVTKSRNARLTSHVQNRRLTASFRTDTEAKRAEIARLSTQPETFNATRCSACTQPIDLPVVHFMCKHSFHQRCLNAPLSDIEKSKVECPKCATSNATVRAIRKAQEEAKDRHDLFTDALKRSKDGYATISEWFGRGVMSVPLAE